LPPWPTPARKAGPTQIKGKVRLLERKRMHFLSSFFPGLETSAVNQPAGIAVTPALGGPAFARWSGNRTIRSAQGRTAGSLFEDQRIPGLGRFEQECIPS